MKPGEPYALICAEGRRPEFPAPHRILHPYGSGFKDVGGDPCSLRYGRIRPKPIYAYSHLVVDPVGLDPSTFPQKLASFMQSRHQWNWNKAVVFLSYPSAVGSGDGGEVIAATEELFERYRNHPEILFYFPEMGVEGFCDIFLHFPKTSRSEQERVAKAVLGRITAHTKTKRWGDALKETLLLEELLRDLKT